MKRTETTDAIFGWFIILSICGIITLIVDRVSTWLQWDMSLAIWAAVVITYAISARFTMWIYKK